MSVENQQITVADLVATLVRMEKWMQVVRKGLEAMPQDQTIDVDVEDFSGDLDARQPFITRMC